MATTITSAPWARNWGTRALAVAASSSKRRPFTPAGLTMVGVALERHADKAHRHGGIAPAWKRLMPVAGNKAGHLHARCWQPENGTWPLKGLADLAGLAHREFLTNRPAAAAGSCQPGQIRGCLLQRSRSACGSRLRWWARPGTGPTPGRCALTMSPAVITAWCGWRP